MSTKFIITKNDEYIDFVVIEKMVLIRMGAVRALAPTMLSNI